MELEFLNTEPDFDYSWLPEEELQVPDSIASEDLQTAINCFCDEVKDFLIAQCPEHSAQISYALQHGRTFHTLFTMGHYCPKQLKNLAETITDWIGEVFYYQCIHGAYDGMDPSFPVDPEAKKMLSHPEKSNQALRKHHRSAGTRTRPQTSQLWSAADPLSAPENCRCGCRSHEKTAPA